MLPLIIATPVTPKEAYILGLTFLRVDSVREDFNEEDVEDIFLVANRLFDKFNKTKKE